MVVEFAEKGNLRDYLRQCRNETSTWLSNADKITIALGVAKGMDHLSSMKASQPFLSRCQRFGMQARLTGPRQLRAQSTRVHAPESRSMVDCTLNCNKGWEEEGRGEIEGP